MCAVAAPDRAEVDGELAFVDHTHHQLKSHRGATSQIGVRAELKRGKVLHRLPGGNGGKAGHGNGDEDSDGVGGAQKSIGDGQRAAPAALAAVIKMWRTMLSTTVAT